MHEIFKEEVTYTANAFAYNNALFTKSTYPICSTTKLTLMKLIFVIIFTIAFVQGYAQKNNPVTVSGTAGITNEGYGLNRNPSGFTSYQPCRPWNQVRVATIKCRNFFVAGVQLPICMMPANNQELDFRKAQTAIIFRWTPLVPRPQTVVNYRLQVFEILENQQPVQALRSNQPILDKIVAGQTQFIWQPQGILGFTDDTNLDSNSQRKGWDGKIMGGKKYIWSIQSLDASQNPIGVDGNGEGRSEPIVFKILPLPPSKPTPKTGHVSIIKQ